MNQTTLSVVLLHPDDAPGQARNTMAAQVLPACDAKFKRGVRRVKVTVEDVEDDRTEQQHKYYWAVVLRDVSEQVSIGGQKYTKDAWHEYGKREFLPRKTKKVKVAGRARPVVSTVIASTTEQSIRQMGEYLEKWMAFAAEHEVTISEPLPPHLRPQRRQKRAETVDADGVIHNREEVAA
jgi:hypothetical protein